MGFPGKRQADYPRIPGTAGYGSMGNSEAGSQPSAVILKIQQASGGGGAGWYALLPLRRAQHLYAINLLGPVGAVDNRTSELLLHPSRILEGPMMLLRALTPGGKKVVGQPAVHSNGPARNLLFLLTPPLPPPYDFPCLPGLPFPLPDSLFLSAKRGPAVEPRIRRLWMRNGEES